MSDIIATAIVNYVLCTVSWLIGYHRGKKDAAKGVQS
jgi:hypothetical protein